MDQFLVLIILVLVILSVIDLMVGVSNDAVNFLNSAIGSKAVPFKTIMIVASLGILCGSLFSSGMMEIARSGIFVPAQFSFHDVMIIFLAVMITDVILLDIFNHLGLPTSTTVSIVFELLGAAVALAAYKIYLSTDSWSSILAYINTEKASNIATSILLSVLISFSIGMLVQYISRLLFTFNFTSRLKTVGVVFGAIALTAISYFILIKGFKEVSFIPLTARDWIDHHEILLVGYSFIFFSILSFIITRIGINILKVIIVVGTFALALSFAGNDLVNFIGVPIAAYQSIGIFQAHPSADPETFMMGALADDNMVAPLFILLAAGLVMVFTLWTSKKAKSVIETEMSLTSTQDSADEKFQSNTLSKITVRTFLYLGRGIEYILPKTIQNRIDKQFVNTISEKKADEEEPMFDMVRASVNLMVASSLIAMGTSLKLPLSTTYVTFMVAMGSAFADRAWDRESAVYRVSGVFHVIGGWFVTAGVAFLGAFILAILLKVAGIIAFVGALGFLAYLLYRNTKSHNLKLKLKEEQKKKYKRAEVITMQEIISSSSEQITDVISRSNVLFKEVIEALISQDLVALNTSKKLVKKLQKELDSTNSNLFNFIRSLDDNSVKGSRYYIRSLGYLQDISTALAVISSNSLDHVDNNHKPMKFNQIRDLKYIEQQLSNWLADVYMIYKRLDFSKIEEILLEKEELSKAINGLLDKQIARIRTSENSAKNTKLYFSILLETSELLNSTMKLLRLHEEFQAIHPTK